MKAGLCRKGKELFIAVKKKKKRNCTALSPIKKHMHYYDIVQSWRAEEERKRIPLAYIHL